jgi:DNA primase
MRFDDRYLEEIKSRLRLSDVIGRSVKLRRAGREWVGLSPFAKEKTPSFYVNDEKGFYHDFSSGKHGDLISFLQETERLSFREAIERLAGEAGVPLPATDPKSAEVEKRRQGLTDWLELAAKWFEAELRRSVGADARAYLERRGLPEEQWSRFRLGFAPASRTALKDYLVAKGVRPAEAVEAGLLIAPEDGGAPYDRFRNRVMFPITDPRGRVISFGGRALDADARAKYLNGPDSPVFHKGANLYGLSEARKLLHLAQREGAVQPALVVVEGYMDVIACQRAGVAAVAPLGTALTEEQMDLLWRSHPEPTLCFDGDKAGVRAASKAIDRALPLLKPGRSFQFAVVSGGKDPDDVLREQGAAALAAQLAQTRPLVQQLFEREFEAEPLDTPERRAGLKGRLRAAAAQIADKDVAQGYRDDLLARLDEAFRPAPRAGGGDRSDGRSGGYGQGPYGGSRGRGGRRGDAPGFIAPPTPEGRAAARALPRRLKVVQAAIACYAIRHPDALDPYVERLAEIGFGDQNLADLAREISALYVAAPGLDTRALTGHLASSGMGDLLTEIEKAARQSSAPFLEVDRPADDARRIWSLAFDVVIELADVESALDAAKEDMARTRDAAHLRQLRSRQIALQTMLNDGSVFVDPRA